MGNCIFGGLGNEEDLLIKVIKPDGGVLEFYSTVTAGFVSQKFPDQSLFSSLDLLSKPLPNHHLLLPGQTYYLFPSIVSEELKTLVVGSYHIRSNSESISAVTPYRMSPDCNHRVLKKSYTNIISRNNYTRTRQIEKRTKGRKRTSSKGGIWKVKLVINTEELLHILSEDGKTNELIETVRAVAKGHNVVTSSIPSCSSSENVLSLVHA